MLQMGKKRIRAAWIVMVIVMTLMGCGEQTMWHNYQPIADKGWRQGDTLCFKLPTQLVGISDSTCCGFRVELRHQENYKYRKIVLLLDYTTNKGIYTQDTLYIELADSQGHWKGPSIGKLFQAAASKENYISLTDSSYLKMTHLMPDSLLTGISEVGIRLIAHP